MFSKKNRKPLIITALIMAVVIVVLFVLPEVMKARKNSIPETETETETQKETEAPSHSVLIHKTNAGTIEFDVSWLKSDSDSETTLEIKENTLVSMAVTPRNDRNLSAVNIYNASNVDETISSIITEMDDGKYNIDFTMPKYDIVMTFNFAVKETEPAVEPAPIETETETEMQGNPYGLTLHGVTADIITSYNGQFDDQDLLQQIGDALHMDSARSEYYRVTDVTFSTEEYAGEKSSDKVYYYLYFNDDSNWRVLSTYYLKDKTYVFTEEAEETEAQTESMAQDPQAGTQTYAGGNSSTGGTQGTAATTTTVVISLDIMSVSSNFLKFTGGDGSTFYDKIFEYVKEKGLTGELIGTMGSYEIDPEKQTASFSVSLNTGAEIKGTYKKSKNKYSFSGL